MLLLCNILTALGFLIACYGSSIQEGKYWYAGLFTLASFYLFITLLCFLLLWIFIKPSRALISVVSIACCWTPLKQIIRLRPSQDFTIKKNPSALRVLSWNVELLNLLDYKAHPEKKQWIINTINELNPDVICFQEMAASDSFPKAINYLPDILKKIGMSEFVFTYVTIDDFDAQHHFGKVIVSKFPIVNKQIFSLPPHRYNVTFQVADIVRESDTFRIFNVHLQSLRLNKKNRDFLESPALTNRTDIQNSKSILSKIKAGFFARHQQSDFITKIKEKSPYPVILCGDFNDVPNSYAYHTIGKGMTNAFVEKGWGIGNTFDGISPTLRIDNIFVDTVFKVTQFKRIKKKLSDHFPIVADLSFKKQ